MEQDDIFYAANQAIKSFVNLLTPVKKSVMPKPFALGITYPWKQ